jgi:uncharacterized protein YbaP (TraB family)
MLANLKLLPFYLYIVTFFGFSSFAQTKTLPLLYEVFTDHGSSYLLGTEHAQLSVSDFSVDLRALLSQTTVFMPEIDLTGDELAQWQKDPQSYLVSVAQKRPLATQPVLPKTAQKLIRYGIPSEAISKINVNRCDVLVWPFEFTKKLPLDAEMIQAAHKAKLKVIALDSDQLRNEATGESGCSLDEIFADNSISEIHDEIQKSIDKDVALYRSGAEPDPDNDPAVKLRNLIWTPRIQEQIDKNRVFISVGYGHLYGPTGLIQILRNLGYSVSRVK